MIKKAKDVRVTADSNLRGGKGTVTMEHFVEKDESFGSGRLFAKATLPPGSSIGTHKHEGEYEIYYILQGTAHVMDNDEPKTLEPGSMMICKDGDSHMIENKGTEDVVAIFLVLYSNE